MFPPPPFFLFLIVIINFFSYIYIGNGKIGLPIVGNEQLYIFYKRSLSVPISYHPVVQVDIPGASSQGNFLKIKI